MSTNTKTYLYGLLIMAFQFSGHLMADLPKPPNIIFLMADDLSPMWFSAYGEKEKVHTPNFDRMIKEGVGFSNAWSTPMCSPTRALVATGQYGTRTGWLHNNLKVPVNNSDFLKNGISPFFRQVKQAGYRTAFCGRWGIPADWRIASQDFDDYCIHFGNPKQAPKGYNSGEVYEKDDLLWMDFTHKDRPDEVITVQVESKEGYFNQPFLSRYWAPALNTNGHMERIKKDHFSSDIFSNFILDMARSSHQKEEPFMVYYPMFLPHDIADNKKTKQSKLPRPPHVGSPGQIRGGTMQSCAEYLDVITAYNRPHFSFSL
jgi:arylsulfatase A-like enzyme